MSHMPTTAEPGGTAVSTSRRINTTAPLQGGADLSADLTLTHAASGVPAGAYTNANITVDAKGHVTAAASGSSAVGPGTTNTIPIFTSASAIGDSPIAVDYVTAARPIVTNLNNHFSVGPTGSGLGNAGSLNDCPFFISTSGYMSVNKVDVTSTGGGAMEIWGGLKVNDNITFGNRNDFDQTVTYAQFGYAGGSTRWRSHHFYDGKGSPIIEFDGSSKVATFRGPISEPRTTTGVAADIHMVDLSDSGSYNCTAAGRSLFAVVAQLSATRSAGVNGLTNTGFYADIYGAQANYAIHTVRGDVYLGQDYQMSFCYVNAARHDVSGDGYVQGDFRVGSSAFGGTTAFLVDKTNGQVTMNSGSNTAIIRSGQNTPEGAITAPVGSIYMRTNGGAATSLYVKESGAGNTGWVAK